MSIEKAIKNQIQNSMKAKTQIKIQPKESVPNDQNSKQILNKNQILNASDNIGRDIALQNHIDAIRISTNRNEISPKNEHSRNTPIKSSMGFNKGTSFILQQARSTIDKIKVSHAHLIDSAIFQRSHHSIISETKLTPSKIRPKSRGTVLDGRLISKTINEHKMSTKYLDSKLKSLDKQIQRSQENSPKGSPEKGKEQISKITSNEDDYINDAARFTNKWYVKVRESVRDVSNNQENPLQIDSSNCNSKSTQTEVPDILNYAYANPEFEKFVMVMYEAYMKLNEGKQDCKSFILT